MTTDSTPADRSTTDRTIVVVGAGLAAAGVYAALGTLLHRIPAFDILAPWAGMLREPEPWSVDACIIASILASGLIAGTAYRLASREV